MDDPVPCTSKNLKNDPTPEDSSENEIEHLQKEEKPLNMSPGAQKLRSWLNNTLRVEMSDGRILIGVFLCTDRDANIILGSCSEYLPEDAATSNPSCSSSNSNTEEPRMLGLVMVPGKHIISICIDQNELPSESVMNRSLTNKISAEDVM